MGALSLTARKAAQRAGFGPLVPGVMHAPYPYCYRCPFGKEPESCAVECVKFIEDTLLKTVVAGRGDGRDRLRAGAGRGRLHRAAAEVLRRAAARRRNSTASCWWSTKCSPAWAAPGKMWAAEHFDLVPDIFAVAKGIASGMPLGATVARADLMTGRPGAHASTFGGNPVACAAALVTIELLEEEPGRERGAHGRAHDGAAADLAGALPQRRRRARTRADDRHRAGARSADQGEGAASCATAWSSMAFERGLLVLGAGDNTIRLCPPLVITRDQCDFALDTLEECLKTASTRE